MNQNEEIDLKALDCAVCGITVSSQSHKHSSVFYIPEMDCDEEIALIRRKLNALEGILDLEFNMVSQKLTVEHRSAHEKIVRALREIKMSPQEKRIEHDEKAGFWETRGRLILTILSGLLAGAGFLLSRLELRPLIPVSLYSAAILAGGWLVARKAFYALRSLSLDINVLMALAVAGAAVIGEWLEGATVIFLFSLANLLESYSMNRARRSITSLMDLAPNVARLRSSDGEKTVAVEEVRIGDLLVVRPGERIALDGGVQAGHSGVDQSPITGESMPVEKAVGDMVFGGSINGDGYLEIRVTNLSRDTTLARIIHSVEEAHSRKAPAQSFVDKFAKYYTPAVVLAAALVAVLPPLLTPASWGLWFYRALVLLVVACPCALVISTPVTIVSALARATRDGILFKGGVFLEAIGSLKAFAFDKTGTLTYGKPEISSVIALKETEESEVLRIAAAIESRSEHHLAGAILREASRGGLKIPAAGDFRALAGKGATATIKGRRFYIGNHRLFEEMGWCYPELDRRLETLEKEGKTAVILGADSVVLAVLTISDNPRDESEQAVAALKRLGVRRTVLLTGDNRSTAAAIAGRVGLDDCRAELLPEDKVKAVRQLVEDYGGVAMVGDGINDAPALASATVGIAMGVAGSDAALETADVALMSDDLSKLPLAVQLGRRAMRLIKQNISFSILLKAVFLALTPFGLTTLWMAVLADMGASLLVIFNGLRALSRRIR